MSLNHGANLFDLSRKLGFDKKQMLDYSSNINPFGSSEKAKRAVIDNIDDVSIYPDPEYKNLKSAICDYCNCNSENVILGSGATELISSFIKTVNPKSALLISPAYSEYEKELNKIECNTVKYFADKNNDFEIDHVDLVQTVKGGHYDLLIICNPNNPTGFAFNKDQIKYILNSLPNTFVMVDETYVEFTDMNTYSSTPLVDEFDKLFVIRGTSKFFSTPGIRLGYGLISNDYIKQSINKNLDLWNINIFATLMGEAMFRDCEYIQNTVQKIKNERTYLLENLNSINDLKVYDSKGNFILCEIKSKRYTSNELYNKLIEHKIIIRNCVSFDSLDEYFFRVCILTPENNEFLIENLKNILQ